MSKAVEQVWVIQSNGLCALHKNYSQNDEISVDQEIFSDFIVAIFSFAQSFNRGVIEIIKIKDRTIYYLSQPEYIIAIASGRNLMIEEAKKLLEEIDGYLRDIFSLDSDTIFLNANEEDFEALKLRLDEFLDYDLIT
ncbi:MAG: hypothetical protein ACXADA_04105 [Candidatus Hodarchaeales archaeon]